MLNEKELKMKSSKMFTGVRVYPNSKQIFLDLKDAAQAPCVTSYLLGLAEVSSVTSKNKLVRVTLNTNKGIWNKMLQWYTYWDENSQVNTPLHSCNTARVNVIRTAGRENGYRPILMAA